MLSSSLADGRAHRRGLPGWWQRLVVLDPATIVKDRDGCILHVYCGRDRGLQRLILVLFGLVLTMSAYGPSVAQAADCIHRTRFHFTSAGPWSGTISTSAGKPCGGSFHSGGNTVFRRLNLLRSPQHGSIALRQGGYFTYTPATGFRGSDSFQLQVCGKEGTIEGCADLNYAATVN